MLESPRGSLYRSVMTAYDKVSRYTQDGEKWIHYDLEQYERMLEPFLKGRHLVDLLKDAPEPTVVHLMAPTTVLAELFSQLPPEKRKFGIAVALTDERTQEEKDRDEKLGITLIAATSPNKKRAGNLLFPSVWRKVRRTLGNRKANLVMAVPIAGIHYLPQHPDFFSFALNQEWGMLDKNGTIFNQLPSESVLSPFGSIREGWLDDLRESGLDPQVHHYGSPVERILHLRRKLNSPSTLSFRPS